MAEGGLPGAQAPEEGGGGLGSTPPPGEPAATARAVEAPAGELPAGRRAGRPWLHPLLVFAVALALRVGYVLTLPPTLEWDDARHYDRVARRFLEGDGLILDERHEVEKPPAYPLFLAGVYLVNYHLHGGDDILADDILLVRLLQALVSAATVLLIWWSAGRLWGRTAALVAGLLAALYPFSIYYCGALLSETLAVFLMALALASLVALVKEKAPRYAVAAGGMLGLLALTRASFLLLAPVVGLVWLLVRKPRGRGGAAPARPSRCKTPKASEPLGDTRCSGRSHRRREAGGRASPGYQGNNSLRRVPASPMRAGESGE